MPNPLRVAVPHAGLLGVAGCIGGHNSQHATYILTLLVLATRHRTGTWHEGLVDYTGGTEAGALQAEQGLSHLGAAANIKFRFDQRTNWQPVESQRLLLWAGRHGKAEGYMDRLNYRHFELGESASERSTLLDACGDAGLDTTVSVSVLARPSACTCSYRYTAHAAVRGRQAARPCA